MNDLQPVALGEEPADLVVRNGRVLVPEVGEFQAVDVAVKNNRVAALPDDAGAVIDDDTRIINASGRVVSPGFVDAHTHLDLHQTFENAYHYAVEGGTTTVVSEVTGFGPAFGAEGVEQLLAATSYLPVRVRATVPPQPLIDTFEPGRADERSSSSSQTASGDVHQTKSDAAHQNPSDSEDAVEQRSTRSQTESADADDAEALADLLGDDRVVGVGETDWIHAVGRDTPAEALYERAHRESKTVTGHGAGCSDEKLTAFATVVDDDHEAITGEEIVARVEQGVHAVGRYGSIRDDVEAVADAYDEIGADEISLSSDGMWPRDLIGEGYMDAVVRRTIEEGVPPADALRMATLNPARHFGLENLGSLAPGNLADIVLIDDLEAVNVTTVVSGGEVVYNHHESTVAPRSHEYPDRFYDSVDVNADPETFRVPASAAADGAVRAVEYEGGLLSTETRVEPPIEGDQLTAAPDGDVLKVTLLDRHPDGDGTGFTGFLTGFGLAEGAVATSVTWETPGVLAVGGNDEDMRAAVTRINEMGGGWAVVADGEVVTELPTRVAGVCSDLEVEETAKLYDAVESTLRGLGVEDDRPMLGLQTLTFRGVPSLKLSFSGYADIFAREVVGLTPE